MDLNEFTDITLAVVQDQGVDTYAPTLIVDGVVQVIQGIPLDLDHRDAIQQVIARQGIQNQDFFFGVRSGPKEVTTGHNSPEGVAFMRISAMQQGYMVSEVERCEWWNSFEEGGH